MSDGKNDLDLDALRETVAIGNPDEAVEAAFTLTDYARRLRERVAKLERLRDAWRTAWRRETNDLSERVAELEGGIREHRGVVQSTSKWSKHNEADLALWSLLDTPQAPRDEQES